MAWQCFFLGGGESKHPSLPLARAERKPLDLKKKLNPRTSAHTRSKIKEKHLPFCRCSP